MLGSIHDFRSDTVTRPTPRMMAAIQSAKLGDAARRDDPTVLELERLAADLVGKEAAIFLPSGGMANLAALLAHQVNGREVVVEQDAHIYNSEGGAISVLAGGILRSVRGPDGIMDPSRVEAVIRGEGNPAVASTALVCIENTHNAAGGMVVPLVNMAAIRQIAAAAQLPVHLDGARLFNAAAYLDVPAAAIGAHVDSLMFAVCKGLGAPVGAVLAGDHAFIQRAWRAARMLGGGMRQAGILAAAAIVALEDPTTVLRRDQALAQHLALGLAGLDESLVSVGKVHTNIVNCHVDRFAADAGAINAALRAHGVLCNATGRKIRFVTHYGVDERSVEAAISAFSQALNQMKTLA